MIQPDFSERYLDVDILEDDPGGGEFLLTCFLIVIVLWFHNFSHTKLLSKFLYLGSIVKPLHITVTLRNIIR